MAVGGGVATATWLNKIAKDKTNKLLEMFAMEPIHVEVKDPRTKKLRPHAQGEHLLYLWDEIYGADPMMRGIIVETVTGPSTPGIDYYEDPGGANPVYPYQQLRALVGDGGKWKWPEIWKTLDLLPRRGPAWRHIDDPSNLGKIENPNPQIKPLNCLVVGGGPVGCRLAIELALGGHRVTLWERRREVIDEKTGLFETVGFTNRVNRPHINNFCRNDLDRLNGRNFMTPKMCYPVFTNAHTSSIGIDECQMLLMKTALLLGVDFRLGVGYVDAEVDVEDEQNQRPSWMVEFKCDAIAQKRYDMPGEGEQRFDALFGCDGGRSAVRETQAGWLGEPKTRKYKKMFGIVSNLQKVSRSKLRELGHANGLEPDDRAGQATGIFFYKASYHNYFIVHPSSEEMEANGIPWRGIFSFQQANREADQEKEDLKSNLRTYMTKKAKDLGIPIDETLENGGFVKPPNDVMGFDFSEFYNCEKSASCLVPPLDWDVDEDGEWEVHCPLVALCGDAVADPNWLLGVGLRRGWTSAMDACFYADNIYNNVTFNGQPPDLANPQTEPVEWSEHMDNMLNLMTNLSNASREGKLSDEMNDGMLEAKGPVVLQIQRGVAARGSDAPVPQYQISVEPWGRYRQYTQQVKKNYTGKNLHVNQHPLAVREIAIHEYNEQFVERGDALRGKVTRPHGAMLTWPKRFTCSAFWGMNKLLEIDGKAAPGEKPVSGTPRGARKKSSDAAGPPARGTPRTPRTQSAAPPSDDADADEAPKPSQPAPPKFNPLEVAAVAQKKSTRLRESIIVAAMSGPTPQGASEYMNDGIQGLLSKFGSPSRGSLASRPSLASPAPVQSQDMKLQSPLQSPTPIARPLFRPPKEGGSIAPPGMTQEDLKAIRRLSTQLDAVPSLPIPAAGGGGFGGVAAAAAAAKSSFGSAVSDELQLAKIKYEKDTLNAKLVYAKAEVEKVRYEQMALEAKMKYAETEVANIQKLLLTYQDIEAELNDD